MREISWLAANQLAAQEGLCTVEKVTELQWIQSPRTLQYMYTKTRPSGESLTNYVALLCVEFDQPWCWPSSGVAIHDFKTQFKIHIHLSGFWSSSHLKHATYILTKITKPRCGWRQYVDLYHFSEVLYHNTTFVVTVNLFPTWQT